MTPTTFENLSADIAAVRERYRISRQMFVEKIGVEPATAVHVAFNGAIPDSKDQRSCVATFPVLDGSGDAPEGTPAPAHLALLLFWTTLLTACLVDRFGAELPRTTT